MKEFSEFFGNFNDFFIRSTKFFELQSMKTQYILRKISAPHLEGFNKKFDFLRWLRKMLGWSTKNGCHTKVQIKENPLREIGKKNWGGRGVYLKQVGALLNATDKNRKKWVTWKKLEIVNIFRQTQSRKRNILIASNTNFVSFYDPLNHLNHSDPSSKKTWICKKG